MCWWGRLKKEKKDKRFFGPLNFLLFFKPQWIGSMPHFFLHCICVFFNHLLKGKQQLLLRPVKPNRQRPEPACSHTYLLQSFGLLLTFLQHSFCVTRSFVKNCLYEEGQFILFYYFTSFSNDFNDKILLTSFIITCFTKLFCLWQLINKTQNKYEARLEKMC